MSAVRLFVHLDTGEGMSYTPQGGMSDATAALAELERGYKLVRAWLQAQLPPSRAPVEQRAGEVH